MKIAKTKNEKELLNALDSMVNQHCRQSEGELDSIALSANAYAMRLLEEYGRIEITAESGRRVIAKQKAGE